MGVFLFIKKNRAVENIPQTENALCQHVKRATCTLQALMWKYCLEKHFKPTPPDSWGWEKSNEVHLHLWITIPVVKNLSNLSVSSYAHVKIIVHEMFQRRI